MRLDRFDLNLLVVLDTLLEEKNVTRAGQRLHLGQSGASAALRRLRAHFDDELLVPVGRRLELTPLAQSLVEPVRAALLHARCALARRPGFDPATARQHFVIRASDYSTVGLMGRAAKRIAAEAPGLLLEFRPPPRDLAAAFDHAEFDLIVIPQLYIAEFDYPRMPLFGDAHACIAWTENPRVGDTLTFEQYLELGHVCVRFAEEKGPMTYEDPFLPQEGPQRRVECRIENFGALPLFIVGTERIATVPMRLAQHFARHYPIRILPVPFELPDLEEAMAWPHHLQHDPAHAWMREQIQAEAAAMAQPEWRGAEQAESMRA